MKKNTYLSLLMVALFCSSSSLHAGTNNDYPMLNFTAGIIGILDGPPKNANNFGIEYRSKKITKWDLIPAYGYSWSDNSTQYGYADLKHDWEFSNNLVFTTSLGIGLFDNSDDLDLGHAIEFRSGFELSYRFNKGYRLGLAAIHLSNSKIANKNPGTELFVVSFLMPLHR